MALRCFVLRCIAINRNGVLLLSLHKLILLILNYHYNLKSRYNKSSDEIFS